MVAAVEHVDAGVYVDPCTVCQELAGLVNHDGDGKGSWTYVVVAVAPVPCVPFADRLVALDKTPGMVDVMELVLAMVAQLLQLLAFEKLYLALDVASLAL